MPDHHDRPDHASNQHNHQDEDRYDEEFWEDRYRSQDAIWSGRPNHVLVAEVGDIVPGTALDVGCGEGGDAIWLAQQGWKVTAVDFSTVALERGSARAKELGLDGQIQWVHGDLLQWRPGVTYDLVNCQYLHLLRTEQEDDLLPMLAGAVAPGGTLLYVSHFFEGQIAEERPHLMKRFLSTEGIARLLDVDQWEISTASKRGRPDAGEHPAGHAHDSVLRAHRRN
jgi:SAM-dependent methyltransferase